MIILSDTDSIAELADADIRQLIEQRIEEISESCPWDADELGPIIVVEPGDTVQELEAEIGFSILCNRFNGAVFGDENFKPCFELAELHGEHLFELVYVVSDGGYGYDIFIPNRPGTDPDLLTFCQHYATPAPQ